MSDLELLERRLERERVARKHAEALLEAKSREVYLVNEELRRLNERLEDLVHQRTAELEESLGHLSATLESMAEGLLVIDDEGRAVRHNHALEQLFVLTGPIQGRPLPEVLGPAVAELFESVDAAALLRGGRVDAELALPGGRTGKATLRAILRGGDPSAPIGRLLVVRDITREKEIDRMKTDFISNVSHELRTPLTSVLGFAKIIRKRLDETVLPALPSENSRAQRAARQAVENVDIIVKEGERLTTLINDVLDIAKMEAGKIEWKKAPLQIGELIARAFATTRALLDAGGLTAILDIEPDLPEVEADHDRILQVLLNLISNAVKFSGKGAITARARMDHERGELVVSVEDQGAGIAPEDHATVFEKFKQVGDTLTDKPKGTGLGLPICRQIIEHHQGKIWLESALGEGSRFYFSLPLPASRRGRARTVELRQLLARLQSAGAPTEPLDERATVLIADDEPHIRGLLRQELEAAGYRVIEAVDGLAAVQRI